MNGDVRAVLDFYPRIYFACHTRHVQDPVSRRTLSRHQASILDHLDEVEGTSLLGLAQHMGVTPGTMSVAVDRLVRRGYVARVRDTADKRRVSLRLSQRGVAIRNASSVLDPVRVEVVLDHLSAADRDAAIRGLRLLAEASQKEMHSKTLYGLKRRARATAPRARTGGPQ
jgi:DNA-binding MarR family transcriptional regulator